MTLLRLVGDCSVWVALVSSLAFCALYAVLAPWRSTGEGWHLMTFTAVLAAAFGWLAYRQTTAVRAPLPMSTEAARAVILAALAGLLVWRLALLIQAQSRRRKR